MYKQKLAYPPLYYKVSLFFGFINVSDGNFKDYNFHTQMKLINSFLINWTKLENKKR